MLFGQAHPKVTKQHMTRMFNAMMAALSEKGPSISDIPPTLAFKPSGPAGAPTSGGGAGGGAGSAGAAGGALERSSLSGEGPSARGSMSGDGRQGARRGASLAALAAAGVGWCTGQLAARAGWAGVTASC
jgi:hypothetical protein